MIGGIDQSVTIPAPVNRVFSSNGTDTGFTGGGQAGCNWQHPQNWVFGIEGDINYADVKRSHNFAFSFNGEDTVGTQETVTLAQHGARSDGLRLNQPSSTRLAVWPRRGEIVRFRDGDTQPARFDPPDIRTDGRPAPDTNTHSPTGFRRLYSIDLGEASYNVVRVFGASGLPPTWPAKAKVDGDIVRVGVNVKLTP
jgi:hypothetical protein